MGTAPWTPHKRRTSVDCSSFPSSHLPSPSFSK